MSTCFFQSSRVVSALSASLVERRPASRTGKRQKSGIALDDWFDWKKVEMFGRGAKSVFRKDDSADLSLDDP